MQIQQQWQAADTFTAAAAAVEEATDTLADTFSDTDTRNRYFCPKQHAAK